MNPPYPTVSTRPSAGRKRAPKPSVNPILSREVRARWRTWPAFATVLCYALFLAGAVLYRYIGLSKNEYNVGQTATLGRELFSFMLRLQTLGWLLIAPLLTATSITSERERGTLLGLHLSRLKPSQIAWGKYWSAAGFIALLLFAPLPVMAVCFLLGGVSVWEFAASFALQAATASVSAAIGLFASARKARTNAAIGTSLLMVGLWNCLPPFALFSPWLAVSNLVGASDDAPAIFVTVFSLLLGPIATLFFVSEAAHSLVRPHAPEATPNKVDQTVLSNLGATTVNADEAPRPHALGDLKRLPLVGSLSFENPVLQRELRVKLQVREGSLGTRGHTPPFLIFALAAFYTTFAAFLILVPDAAPRLVTWNVFSLAWLACAIGATALWASSAFTREREAGMLSSLRLSLLSRGDILRGKAFAPLLALGYYSLSMIPVMLPCLRGLDTGGRNATGVPLTLALSTLLLILGGAWLGTSVGLLWSWFSRATWIAMTGTMATLLLLLAGPLLLSGDMARSARVWNPFATLYWANAPTLERASDSTFEVASDSALQWFVLQTSATQCVLCFVVGALGLTIIWRGLNRPLSTEAAQTRGS